MFMEISSLVLDLCTNFGLEKGIVVLVMLKLIN